MPLLLLLLLLAISAAFPTIHSSHPSSSLNCSYNGVWCQEDGTCSCFTGWKGQYCESLDLLPTTNRSGLNLLYSENTSTWGGSVLWDEETSRYHMFASEMAHHCGIHRWVSSSVVVRAVSRGAVDDWKFTRVERILNIFAHEPIVVRDPTTNQVVLFVTYFPGDASDCGTCVCRDGNSASGGCADECGSGQNKTMFSYFMYTDSIDSGNWSDLVSLCHVQINGDCRIGSSSGGDPHVAMNLAPIIRNDGSLLAWTRWDIWQAATWKNPASYVNTGHRL